MIVGALATLVMVLGLSSGAFAAKDDNQGKAGPNDRNNYGLCTAASNGEKNGWTDGALPRPFAGAPDGGTDSDRDGGSRTDFIDEFCNPFPTPGGK